MAELKSSLPKSSVLTNCMFIFCLVIVLTEIGIVYYHHNILEIEFNQKLKDYVRRNEIDIILSGAGQVIDNKRIQKKDTYSNFNNLDSLNKNNLDKENNDDEPCIKLTKEEIAKCCFITDQYCSTPNNHRIRRATYHIHHRFGSGYGHQKGEPGEPGLPGDPGPPGPPGLPGLLGAPGPKGLQGPPGLGGSPGRPGAPGSAGQPGIPGYKGSSGSSGIPGKAGERGPKGEQGTPGLDGLPGVQGLPGKEGPAGLSGEKGSSGPVGPPGPSGREGTKGEKGEPGLSGLPGIQGPPGNCNQNILNKTDYANLNNLKITKYGDDDYQGYPPRRMECNMYDIGNPIYFGSADHTILSWMIDSAPLTEKGSLKFWATSNDNFTLFEYDTNALFLSSRPSKSYVLITSIEGTANIIYKGSFFYKGMQRVPRIIKFNLHNGTSQVLTIPKLKNHNMKHLYKTRRNYFDLSVDDNGLWVIFADADSNNTAVAKVDADMLKIQYIWNITLDHRKYTEMFIAYGVLYAIDDFQDGKARISVGIDLYTNTALSPNIKGFGEFQYVTMASYDFNKQQLLIWDNGNKLSFLMYCERNDIFIGSYFSSREKLSK